jgi:hypothetical protein
MRGIAGVLVIGLSLLGSAARANPVFAVVVGVNQPLDQDTRTLLYADDDAVLFHKILSRIGTSVLLVEPDSGTARLHGTIPGARRPTRANLVAALREVQGKVQRSRDLGGKPHFYFLYSGHGDVKNNLGYLALADGRLSARDLADLVLAPSRATINHVIVDACKSYFLVNEKRAGGERRPLRERLDRDIGLAERFPNTGFLLSTSSGAASHEWEEYQAGIFSHEVRSGMIGAADVNGDGRVSYNEIRAFIDVANSAIPNDRFRPRVFVRAPGDDGRHTLLKIRRPGGPLITVPARSAGRYTVEDDRGVRLADLHSAATSVTLLLTSLRRIYVHDLRHAVEYLVDPRPGQRLIAALPTLPSTYRAKGAAHEAFNRIFARPFDLAAYRRSMQLMAQDDPKFQRLRCVRCECLICEPDGPEALDDEPPTSRLSPPPPRPTTTVVAEPRRAPGRHPWEKAISAHLGLTYIGHNFDFKDPVAPSRPFSFHSGLSPAIALAFELYPLAFRGHRDALTNLGLHLSYWRVINLKAHTQDSTFDAVNQQLEAGLRYRWNLLGRATSPILTPSLSVGRLGFSIAWDPATTTSALLPDTTYLYLKLGLIDLEVPLITRRSFSIGLEAHFSYLWVLTAGGIESNDSGGYGSAQVHGLETGGGVHATIGGFSTHVVGGFRHLAYGFDNDCYVKKTGCNAAGGAVDAYASFSFLLGYAY